MIRSVSYGAGVQSTALLVLASQGEIDFDLFLFANVGDDSEHPATLRFYREHAVPFAAGHGIEMMELHRTWKRGERKGRVETLRSRLDAGRTAIPVRRTKDGPPMSRSCTADFKVAVLGDELRRRGATAERPATVGLGISTDEIERATPGIDPRSPWQRRVYPLLDLGLRRTDCQQIIADAGLPVPPPSSCWFCPFHDAEEWRRLLDQEPALFAEAVAIERHLTDTSSDGRPVYLTRHGVPLDQAITSDQLRLDGMDGCDSGFCMT